MHTTTIGSTTFIHNGDYSGAVEISVYVGGTRTMLLVPFKDLKEFVADYVRDRRISKIELEDADDLLGATK